MKVFRGWQSFRPKGQRVASKGKISNRSAKKMVMVAELPKKKRCQEGKQRSNCRCKGSFLSGKDLFFFFYPKRQCLSVRTVTQSHSPEPNRKRMVQGAGLPKVENAKQQNIWIFNSINYLVSLIFANS